jgi:hypothetical protein
LEADSKVTIIKIVPPAGGRAGGRVKRHVSLRVLTPRERRVAKKLRHARKVKPALAATERRTARWLSHRAKKIRHRLHRKAHYSVSRRREHRMVARYRTIRRVLHEA